MHGAYLWAYTPDAFDDMKSVVYDFADGRAGQHAQDLLCEWRGALICDDCSGYKALLVSASAIEISWSGLHWHNHSDALVELDVRLDRSNSVVV